MHQQLRDAHVEPQPELSVLWNGGTDGTRAVHADAATSEATNSDRRWRKGGIDNGNGKAEKDARSRQETQENTIERVLCFGVG